MCLTTLNLLSLAFALGAMLATPEIDKIIISFFIITHL